MVRKNRRQLSDSRFVLRDRDLAEHIAYLLQKELGASRRATKTVMRWTGVSDTTARAWLHGRASPSGVHLLALAAHSSSIMISVLRITGHGNLEIGLTLSEIEADLEAVLERVRMMREHQGEREKI